MRADRLKKMREALHLTQEDLAERISVGVLQINRYENNKTEPNGEVIARIATALNVSSDYLLGLTDDPNPDRRAPLNPHEWAIIAALRRGEKLEAVKAIVDDE